MDNIENNTATLSVDDNGITETNTEKENQPDKLIKWIDAHAGDLATICALFSASIIGYAILDRIFNNAEHIRLFWQYILGSLFLLITGLVFFTYRESQTRIKNEESTTYVVSTHTIRTLKAIGVPQDIIKCLELMIARINKDKTQPDTEEIILEISAKDLNSNDSWMTELETRLNKVRISEYKDTILKYSLRTNNSDQ